MAQERLRLFRRRGVETVILAGSDTHGIMRGKRVPIAELDRDHDEGAIRLSPRAVLRSVVERARAIGVEPIVGVELEFDVLRETPRSILAKRPSQVVAADERPTDAAGPLPATLGEATDLLEHSALARDWLGDDVVEHVVAMRRAELAAQASAVTDWEMSRYLEAL